MPVPYQPDDPDSQTIRVEFSDDNVIIDRWISYEFASDFLTPTDSFSLTLGVGDDGLPDEQRAALKIGTRVRLYVESNILADGRIDSIDVTADRHAGTTYAIRGRDRLGQTLDAVMDPRFHLKNGGSLADLLKRSFSAYGWSGDEHFVIDNAANRDAKKGKRGFKNRNKSGTPKRKAKLTQEKLHQTKPYNHESVFHFASRVAQRHGLWIWCSGDGETLIVGTPDYDQEPDFVLRRAHDGTGNVLSGHVRFDLTDQPSIIMADTFVNGGGGEFGKGRSKAYIINPLLGLDDEGEPTTDVKKLLAAYPTAIENTLPGASFPFRVDAKSIPFRPMFLHDDESKTPEQINNFVKREMSLLYRKALTASYTVEGHGQTVDGQFTAWTPDTVVDVVDDVAGLRERLYVLGVHFSKSRSGTTTALELVRCNSIVF